MSIITFDCCELLCKSVGRPEIQLFHGKLILVIELMMEIRFRRIRQKGMV